MAYFGVFLYRICCSISCFPSMLQKTAVKRNNFATSQQLNCRENNSQWNQKQLAFPTLLAAHHAKKPGTTRIFIRGPVCECRLVFIQKRPDLARFRTPKSSRKILGYRLICHATNDKIIMKCRAVQAYPSSHTAPEVCLATRSLP